MYDRVYDYFNRQKMRDLASQFGGNEKLAEAAVLASVLAGPAALGTAGLVDLGVGNNTIMEDGPGELGVNAVLAALLPATGGSLGYDIGNAFGAPTQEQVNEAMNAKANNVSAKDMKEQLKKTMREKGEAAARAEFAAQKNKTVDKAAVAREFNRRTQDSRMAGMLIGALLGTGLGVNAMVDREQTIIS